MPTTATEPYWTTFDSPLGPVTLVGSGDALGGVYFHEHRHQPPVDPQAVEDRAPFAGVIEQLEQYFAGERTRFDIVVEPARGTPFQRRVWELLREIPYGETRSYGQLAVQLGTPGASRAVGLANGRNPVSIIVPCHRVIGASGALTGYGGGIERKRWLLELETPRLLP